MINRRLFFILELFVFFLLVGITFFFSFKVKDITENSSMLSLSTICFLIGMFFGLFSGYLRKYLDDKKLLSPDKAPKLNTSLRYLMVTLFMISWVIILYISGNNFR